MKTSTSPLQQIPSGSILFSFLILLAYGTVGQDPPMEPITKPTNVIPSTVASSISQMSSKVTEFPFKLPTEKLSTVGKNLDVSSRAHPVSKLLVNTPSNEGTIPARTPSLELLSTPKPLEPKTIAKHRQPATLKQTKPADTTADIHTTADQEAATTVTTTPEKTNTTQVEGKSHTTDGETTFSIPTAGVNISLKPRSTKREKDKSTIPGRRVQGDLTTHDTSSWGPETQYTTGTSTMKASEADAGLKDNPLKGSRGVTVTPTVSTSYSDTTPPMARPAKDSRGIIVAVVLSILLLLILLIALLCCWRQRHSGSTSFKTEAWAGQAVLPDDTGVDKEVEQGVLAAGEGETRRATLTTFFGKRQSRVPSVAMVEVVQKKNGDLEEAQLLIDGDENRVSSLEGSGEANGQIPKPTKQCSQEKEFPPPPANPEETPPMQLE